MNRVQFLNYSLADFKKYVNHHLGLTGDLHKHPATASCFFFLSPVVVDEIEIFKFKFTLS